MAPMFQWVVRPVGGLNGDPRMDDIVPHHNARREHHISSID
jgi:hypothetical protein